MTTWTDDRLRRLFERYRVRYWPRSRRLRAYHIRAASLDRTYGQCETQDRVILVDIAQHPSDRAIRATILHEMVHAVVGRGGHDAAFWTQLEYLLARAAPITVGFPELGERAAHLSQIPPRFRRCRRLFRPVYLRSVRSTMRGITRDRLPVFTPRHFERDCEDVAVLEGELWRVIWAVKAFELGFIDLDGRVLPSARPYQVAGRRGARRGRRFFLENKRAQALFESFAVAAPTDPPQP